MTSFQVATSEARAKAVRIDGEALSVDLIDGRTILVPLGWYPRLWHGSDAERRQFELLDDGSYIHWPALDEDLAVGDLLAGRRSAESPSSLKRWLARR